MRENLRVGPEVGTRPPGRAVTLTLLVLFFLSGACGLVYEVVWMRMLTLVFGATAFATSTILAAFFTGLALGGAWFGRMVDRGRHPLTVYAALEAGVGVFAFLMPVLLGAVTTLYVGVSRGLGLGYHGGNAVRFVLSFAVLVAPAILMGGTLPVVVKYLARSRARVGRQISLLYALNTLGAVVGTLAAGFVLILVLGTREAAYAAGVLNLAIAGVAYLLARRERSRVVAAAPAIPAQGPEVDDRSSGTRYAAGHARITLVAIGLAGFGALALEVFWTRSLVFFLDNSTHAFTTILTCFLLGIGAGSLLVAPLVDRGRNLLAWLGGIQVLIGLSALMAIPVVQGLTPVFERMADASLESGIISRWTTLRFVNVLSVVLVPTVLMGMAFPVASRICTRQMGRVGTALGNVYAVNTLGGVLGSLVAGFVLLPMVGLRWGILLVVGLHLLVGMGLIGSEPGLGWRIRGAGVAAAALAALGLGLVLPPEGGMVLASHYEDIETDSILHYEEGVGGTVKVYEDRFGDRILSINGFPVAGEPPEYQDAQKGLAHFPLLLSPVDSPTVGIVGFGAGGTSWGALQHSVKLVETAELVPEVPEAAHFFPTVNHGVLDQPRFNLVLGDGRNHMLVTDRVYDVVSIDATSPKMAGNGSLYARDFYELLHHRTSDRGIAVQWIPHHLLSDGEVRMTIRSFQAVFPYSTLWFSPMRQNMVLIGSKVPVSIDFQRIRQRMANPAVRRDLALVNIGSATDFLAGFVMGEQALASYVGSGPLNTDNHPYLEFTPALAYFVGNLYRLRNVLDFQEARESVLPYLVNLGATEAEADSARTAVLRREAAVSHSLQGDVFMLLGERRRAVEAYRRALATDPGDKNWLNTALGFTFQRDERTSVPPDTTGGGDPGGV